MKLKLKKEIRDDDDDDVVVVVVECRICQEEDLAQAMEAPCSCNGTLKVGFS